MRKRDRERERKRDKERKCPFFRFCREMHGEQRDERGGCVKKRDRKRRRRATIFSWDSRIKTARFLVEDTRNPGRFTKTREQPIEQIPRIFPFLLLSSFAERFFPSRQRKKSIRRIQIQNKYLFTVGRSSALCFVVRIINVHAEIHVKQSTERSFADFAMRRGAIIESGILE